MKLDKFQSSKKMNCLIQTVLRHLLINLKKKLQKLIKKQIITFYQKFIKLYDSDDNIDLFRAITFDEPKALVDYLSTMDIELDIRVSVQPNLVKELNIKSKNNAYSFKKYYSIPLNIKAYEILKDKE